LSGCDFFGNNALSLCAQYGYKSLCEYLIGEHKRLGIHLEGYMWPSNVYGDCFGKTPLMLAAEFGHLELIKVLLRNGANPLAKNDINQNALHHCIIKCCPTPSGYKTPFGYILLNTNEWSQYDLSHDDAYKNKEFVWRFNRIIHLLLRFMIFENGDYSAGVYRKNGLKTTLENDDNGKNKTNVWDDAANNGNGAYTHYTLTNNSNWMAYYYLRRGHNKVFHSLTMQQSEELSVFVDKYRSTFIQKTGKNKTYSSQTYSSGDYLFKSKLFTSDADTIVPIIKNDSNMFAELEKGFNRDIWEKTTSKDFIHYFLRYLFYEEPIPKESENDKIQKLLSIKRQIYLLKINQHNLKPFVPANRTLKSYKK
jgi:ankyrin repeat protein